jgi:glycosyltransferase involved in cell wall biosynthesis
MKRWIVSLFAKYEEEIATTCISFWLTILLLRSIAFFLPNSSNAPLYCSSTFHFLISFSFFFLSFLVRKRPALPFFFLGIGLGMISDEMGMLPRFSFRDYWDILNFSSLLSFHFLLLFFLWLASKEEPPRAQIPSQPRPNPENPFISVVIPAYNEENYIGNTLQSLLQQDFQDFEIIVVDNASQDGTAEVARKFGARVVYEGKRTVGAARQRGCLEAKGEIIAMTDADTILPPNWLSRIAEEFKKDEKLVAFGGLYTLYSGPVLARLWIHHFAHFLWIFDKWMSNGCWNIPGSNIAFRKDAFMKVGGFREDLPIGEDVDLSLRLAKVGKVVLDFRFRVATSGRRYRKGFFKGTMTYAKNTIGRLLFKKEVTTTPVPIRGEPTPLRKLPILPSLFLILYLFSLFWLRSPSFASERQKIKREVKKVEVVIKSKLSIGKERGIRLK